ncbi:MAG: NusG domain II-containing protein [Polynucleobacter sp.]|nr:NusG domain II-containing protein [Polynucleobacter sp.]
MTPPQGHDKDGSTTGIDAGREPLPSSTAKRQATERHANVLRDLLAQAEAAGQAPWRMLLKPGDWLLLLVASVLVVASFPLLWRGGAADRAVVKRDGQVVTELALNVARRYEVTGAIGTTVIEVQPGRARVLSDPGPRQYCVQQGWLTRANAVAICAPNHVTLQLAGRGGQNDAYDSLNY